MFRRFNRLVSLPIRNKYEILYNKSKYNFIPNLPTLSFYEDIMSYFFVKSKNDKKYINKSKIPYDEQWEVRDFYVPNKNIDRYIEKNNNRGYDLVVLNDKTITYNDYIQQLFLLDKRISSK